MSRKSLWATIIALSACLAIFSCFISANIHPRFLHHAEAVQNQFAILKGLPHYINGEEHVFPQFQSRVLFPLLLKGLSETHLMSDSQSFIFLRITTAFVAYLVFFMVCTQVE